MNDLMFLNGAKTMQTKTAETNNETNNKTNKKKYLLVDSHNLYFKTRHIAKKNNRDAVELSSEEKRGFLFHLFFNAIFYAYEKFNCSNIVLFFDRSSWRKEYYPNYKLNRKQKELLKTPEEKEEDNFYFEGYVILQEFLDEKTNVVCIKENGLETDDLISEFIFLYPENNYVIFSSDKDYVQLLRENVVLYDSYNEKVFKTKTSFIDTETVSNLNEVTIVEEPEWELFKKIIRGDPSDNIFSVLPGVRETKIRKAFLDRENKGYDWNSFMLQETFTRDGVKKLVKEVFEVNKKIIDLTSKPEEIKDKAKNCIIRSLEKKKTLKGVGIHFIKFCEKYGLETLKNSPEKVSKILNCSFNY